MTKPNRQESNALSEWLDEHEPEPVLVLRAGDILAPDTVRAWADMAERCRADTALVRRARDLALQMESWGRAHGHHVPVASDIADRRVSDRREPLPAGERRRSRDGTTLELPGDSR